jgi:hypothetical protein
MKHIILSALLVLSTTAAFANDKGNGGSGDESQMVALQAQLETVSLKIRTFFLKNEKELKKVFPEFNIQALVKTIKKSDIRIVDKKLTDKYGKDRTCLNFPQSALIECKQSEIQALIDHPSAFFVLVFHEYLGLIGAEETSPNDPLLINGYSISKKIAPFVSKVNEYNLVIDSNSLSGSKLRVGDRVANSGYQGGPRASIITAVIDAEEVLAVDEGTSPDRWELLERTIKMEYISKEVESVEGVKKGLSAICQHLHGEISGTVSHVYANGEVEIERLKTTYNMVFIMGGTPANTFWSTVPSKSEQASYPCKYYSRN